MSHNAAQRMLGAVQGSVTAAARTGIIMVGPRDLCKHAPARPGIQRHDMLVHVCGGLGGTYVPMGGRADTRVC